MTKDELSFKKDSSAVMYEKHELVERVDKWREAYTGLKQIIYNFIDDNGEEFENPV